ncbi:hypothetical protein KR093_001524, partial [Drosophila rubida]
AKDDYENQDDEEDENEVGSDYDFEIVEQQEDAVIVEAKVVPEYKESDEESEDKEDAEIGEEEFDQDSYEEFVEPESGDEEFVEPESGGEEFVEPESDDEEFVEPESGDEEADQQTEEDFIEEESEDDEDDQQTEENFEEIVSNDGDDEDDHQLAEEDSYKEESDDNDKDDDVELESVNGKDVYIEGDTKDDDSKEPEATVQGEIVDDAPKEVNGEKSPEVHEEPKIVSRAPMTPFYAQSIAELKRANLLPQLSIFENSEKTNKVLAVVKENMEWYGTVTMTLLSGRILVNGYEARQLESLTFYSPKGLNWIVLSPLTSKKRPKIGFELISSVLEESFTRLQLERISKYFDRKHDAIVLLQRNGAAQTMIDTFGKHMSENVFPVINSIHRPRYSSEYLLNCLVQTTGPDTDLQKGLVVPKVWTKLALQKNSRFMITGGRGAGKSTLLRYLLNRHLTQFGSVLLVDLDIGQPELFVPQTVSCSLLSAPLLGPGFFYNRQPDLAYVVGHVNIVMCAEPYALAVKRLLAMCRVQERYKDVPWLINTMGYNKGFGIELMALLVDAVRPTALVQISSAKQINNFEVSLDSATLSKVQPSIFVDDVFKFCLPLPKYTMHKLQSAVPIPLPGQPKPWRMSAKDIRYSNILARLSTALRGNAKYLNECQPLKMSIDKLNFLHLTSDVYSRDELIAGTEVNLVYLCKQPVKRNLPIECLGIGVVRAIDYKTDDLYLVPAMSVERCASVNCLVIGGDMNLPQGFIKDQGAAVTDHVPFVFVIDDSKSSKSVQQIYYRPPGFL